MRAAVALALAAAVLGADAAPAGPFREAVEAFRSDDCARLGDVLNRHLDAEPVMRYLAGALHEHGICVDRDLAQAARYYAHADAARDSTAARTMAHEYLSGAHLPRSYGRAGAWLARQRTLTIADASAGHWPPALPALPAERVSDEGEWAGYLVSVAYLGGNRIQYPGAALRGSVQGSFEVRVCVADGSVAVQATAARADPERGVEPLQGRRELADTIEANYREALALLPKPAAAPPGRMCFRQPVQFRIL